MFRVGTLVAFQEGMVVVVNAMAIVVFINEAKMLTTITRSLSPLADLANLSWPKRRDPAPTPDEP